MNSRDLPPGAPRGGKNARQRDRIGAGLLNLGTDRRTFLAGDGRSSCKCLNEETALQNRLDVDDAPISRPLFRRQNWVIPVFACHLGSFGGGRRHIYSEHAEFSKIVCLIESDSSRPKHFNSQLMAKSTQIGYLLGFQNSLRVVVGF